LMQHLPARAWFGLTHGLSLHRIPVTKRRSLGARS
jgi:hypothetical protein